MNINPALLALSKQGKFHIEALNRSTTDPIVATDFAKICEELGLTWRDNKGAFLNIPNGMQLPYYINLDMAQNEDVVQFDFVKVGRNASLKSVWGCAKLEAKRLRKYEILHLVFFVDAHAELDLSILMNASFDHSATNLYFILAEEARLRLQVAMATHHASVKAMVVTSGESQHVALYGFNLQQASSHFDFAIDKCVSIDRDFRNEPTRSIIAKFPAEYAAEILAAHGDL